MQWSALPDVGDAALATMATSMSSWISAVHTFTSFAPLITVSAGCASLGDGGQGLRALPQRLLAEVC